MPRSLWLSWIVVSCACGDDAADAMPAAGSGGDPVMLAQPLVPACFTGAPPIERTDLASVEQPELGGPCDSVRRNSLLLSGDAACVVRLVDGRNEALMFCHPELFVCVRPCASGADCPPGWVCDDRPDTLYDTQGLTYSSGTALCVNPSRCGG